MEWVGWLALSLSLFHASYPGRVKKLEQKLKKMQTKMKGEFKMAKILSELKNKKVSLKLEDSALILTDVLIEDMDEEWIKYSISDKKGKKTTKICRIDSVESVELAEDF